MSDPDRADPLVGTDSDEAARRVVPVPRAGLRIAAIDDQTAILDRSHARFHVLNLASSIVWSLLGEGRTLEHIIDELASESGMEPDAVAAIVETAISGFVESGLVVLVEATGVSATTSDEVPSSDIHSTSDGQGSQEPTMPTRATRRQAWTSTVLRILDRIPGVETHGPWHFGDVVATIATDRAEIGDYLDRLLGPMLISGSSAAGTTRIHIVERRRTEKGGLTVYWDGKIVRRQIRAPQAVEVTLQRLNLMATEDTAGSILLHAGAVEFDGRVVIVAGESGRGKSTLTAALVRSGGAYITDELVIIDPAELDVRPYPKPLDLGRHSLELLDLPLDDGMVVDKRHVASTELGEVSAGGRVAAIVLLGPEDSVEETLAPMIALAELLPNVFDATHEMEGSMVALAHLCTSVPALRLPRATLEDSVRRIEQLIGSTR